MIDIDELGLKGSDQQADMWNKLKKLSGPTSSRAAMEIVR